MLWLYAVVFILLASAAYAAVHGAPWVPTRRRDVARVLRLLDAKPGQTVYELGCGDGRVSVAIARQTCAKVVGVELSLAQWLAASIRGVVYRATPSYKEGDSAARGSLRFCLADAFSVDLSGADAVYLFLMPETYAKLRPKFERELKPGAVVVSYVWPIPGWTPAERDHREGTEDLYRYVR